MKFLVISDTHGRIDKAAAIYNKIGDIDTVIHLGDYEKDASALETLLGCDVISVRGNMDGGYTKHEYKVIDTECGKMLLTHGHIQNVKNSLQSLLYFAEENGCNIVLFGHTHRAVNAEADGMYIINPGSLTLPADGSKGTCAVLTIHEGSFSSEIVEWEDTGKVSGAFSPASDSGTETKKSKNKVQGGFIRDLLNNSDRF